MDGVEDRDDRCPGTLFSDLVDATGCPTLSLASPHHYDLIAGLSYAQYNQYTLQESDTLNFSLQGDYFYKRFSAQINLSSYSYENETALNDTTIGFFYNFSLLHSLDFKLGTSIILPTYRTGYDNEATDYALNSQLIYSFEESSLFMGYAHTLVNDKDTDTLSYQNINAFSLGYGYFFTSKLYASAAYAYSDSIYSDVESIQNISAYMYYPLNDTLFMTLTYAYGLSDSANDHFASLRLGVFY
jgi:hypothetical protein